MPKQRTKAEVKFGLKTIIENFFKSRQRHWNAMADGIEAAYTLVDEIKGIDIRSKLAVSKNNNDIFIEIFLDLLLGPIAGTLISKFADYTVRSNIVSTFTFTSPVQDKYGSKGKKRNKRVIKEFKEYSKETTASLNKYAKTIYNANSTGLSLSDEKQMLETVNQFIESPLDKLQLSSSAPLDTSISEVKLLSDFVENIKDVANVEIANAEDMASFFNRYIDLIFDDELYKIETLETVLLLLENLLPVFSKSQVECNLEKEEFRIQFAATMVAISSEGQLFKYQKVVGHSAFDQTAKFRETNFQDAVSILKTNMAAFGRPTILWKPTLFGEEALEAMLGKFPHNSYLNMRYGKEENNTSFKDMRDLVATKTRFKTHPLNYGYYLMDIYIREIYYDLKKKELVKFSKEHGLDKAYEQMRPTFSSIYDTLEKTPGYFNL